MAEDVFTDYDLIVMLSGVTGAGCSLNRSPKKNWVERGGGLPKYICAIARALVRNGHPMSSAISIAISRAKHWATAGEQSGHAVHPETRAKAAAAVSQWEALKARAHGGHLVKASHMTESGPEDHFIYLANTSQPSYRIDDISRAWSQKQNQERAESGELDADSSVTEPWRYTYVREIWNDFIIVGGDYDGDGDSDTVKVPYSVSEDGIEFGNPVPVHQEWVAESSDDEELDDNDYAALGISPNATVALSNSAPIDALSKIMKLKK